MDEWGRREYAVLLVAELVYFHAFMSFYIFSLIILVLDYLDHSHEIFVASCVLCVVLLVFWMVLHATLST